MISAIFTEMGTAITAFITCVSNALSGVVACFYSTGTNAGLTTLGSLLLLSAACSLVFWAFKLIKGLVIRA